MKNKWQSRFNSTPPKSLATVKMILDWYENEDQVRLNKIIGSMEELSKGNDEENNKDNLPSSLQKLPSNTKLVKTWKGVKYEVMVGSNKEFIYEGKTYKSLTAIAEVITGTHQSGNIFFGLSKNKKEVKLNG